MLYTRLLDSFRSAASVSQTNIDIVTNKTKELIKRSGGWHWFLLIVFLAVLLVVLTFLVIET